MSGEVYYNIEKILDRKKVKDRQLYKIKWEGYPMEQCTWEPIENLQNALILIEEYNKAHPIKSKKTNKSNKTKKEKKEEKLLGIKRKDQETQKIQENTNQPQIQNNNNIIPNNKNNIEENKIVENENSEQILSYYIDNSLKNVATVKKHEGKLMAVVDKMQKNGEMVKACLTTEDLRKFNPWILLDFYESKIKFT